MHLSSLIETTRTTFDTRHASPPLSLTESGCCAECDALSSFLSQHNPASLEAFLLEQPVLEPGALESSFLLTPQAFHYFLPAYLLVGLRTFLRSADTSALLEPTFALAPGAERSERIREYRRHFTPSQVGVIVSYLSFCASHLDADDPRRRAFAHALTAIWSPGA